MATEAAAGGIVVPDGRLRVVVELATIEGQD
jgi:hypothetical protein